MRLGWDQVNQPRQLRHSIQGCVAHQAGPMCHASSGLGTRGPRQLSCPNPLTALAAKRCPALDHEDATTGFDLF